MKLIASALSLTLLLAACPVQAADDGHHPNHMAVATGAAGVGLGAGAPERTSAAQKEADTQKKSPESHPSGMPRSIP